MRQWLPIPLCIFEATIAHLPNPFESSNLKFDNFFNKDMISNKDFESIRSIKEEIMRNCKGEFSENSPILGYISKMVPIPIKNIGEQIPKYAKKVEDDNSGNNNEVIYVPLARLYTGRLKRDQDVFLIGPKHNPRENKYDIQKVKIEYLYFFMGQYLEPVDEVPAGNIFTMVGLENYVYKTSTFSNLFQCPSIKDSQVSVIKLPRKVQ